MKLWLVCGNIDYQCLALGDFYPRFISYHADRWYTFYLGFELSLFGGGFDHALIQKQAVSEVMKYNDLTVKYGLELTEQQAIALVKTRSLSLKETGRIEFGGGIIDKIIYEFCVAFLLMCM